MFPTLLTLLAIQPSHALSCADLSIYPLSPVADSVSVPLNVQPTFDVISYAGTIALVDSSIYGVRLVDEDGSVLPSQVFSQDSESGYTFTLLPEASLEPDTDYDLEWTSNEGETWFEFSAFTTGLTDDDPPPSAPTPGALTSTDETDEWGRWAQLALELQTESTDDSGVWYRIELAEDASFSDAVVRGAGPNRIAFYDNPCQSDSAAFLDPATTWVRVTAIDAAGNESDSVAAVPGEPSATGTTGCSSAGLVQLDALAFTLGMLGLFWRTRRFEEGGSISRPAIR